MTTAERIEGFTDAGEFEILATRVLRELNPDCRSVLHAGVNAQGKTIPNPIDAFCLVPGSTPSRYVMAAFTLTASEGLVGKWLYDHSEYNASGRRKGRPPTEADDGDLIKAAREAATVRRGNPNAEFVVWLCTNRRIDNDLLRPVYEKAAELGIEVCFLEQSRLRDFLDVAPEGQWLRQEHLDIAADRISISLLSRLSKESANRLALELLLPPERQMVWTEAARAAADGLDGQASLLLLVGPSGAGKSVVANQLLRRHVDEGGVGLWIPAEIAEQQASLAEAIATVLRSLHPRAGVGCGHEALELATSDHPLLLVVDDVNRSADPVRLVRKIIGWSRPGTPEGTSQITAASRRVICPVWDSIWFPLKHTWETIAWGRVQTIGPMTRPEAISCLNLGLGMQPDRYTDAELDVFAERLHNDPILLGMFAELMQLDPRADALVVAEDVIGRIIERAIGELAASKGFIPAEYAVALKRLSTEMIRRRSIYPPWDEVKRWFITDHDVRNRLHELAAQGHVCRIAQPAGLPRLEFRHDRIMEYHLILATVDLLSEENGPTLVTDPFFTPMLGRAIARVELTRAVLELIQELNPVSLIAAVSSLTRSRPDYAGAVVELARSWLMKANSYPDSVRFNALWILAGSDTRFVLDVTRGIEGSRLVWEARLRNGDAYAGAAVLSEDLFGEFNPAIHNDWLEAIIDAGRTHHGESLIDQLGTQLRSDGITDVQRHGALCLAGYLGADELAADIRSAWKNAESKQRVLLSALWAGFRCTGDDPRQLLDPMMESLLELEDDQTGMQVGKRGSILRQLRFASRHGYSENALVYLTELGAARGEFQSIVASIFDNIDHPVAIDYVVRLLATRQHSSMPTGPNHPMGLLWAGRGTRGTVGLMGSLSPASVSTLRSIWSDETSSEPLRRYAFAAWASYAGSISDLTAAADAGPDFECALWQRALRGDRTAVPAVLEMINKDPYWFHVLPNIWGPEFDSAVDSALERIATDPEVQTKSESNEHYEVTDWLRDLPTPVAEKLLEKHWSGLSRSYMFCQVALYHGTDQCRELVADAYRSGACTDMFKHVSHTFGFMTQGRRDRVSLHHLESLLPYLDQLEDICLGQMIESCNRSNNWEWAKVHLQPEMRRRMPFAKAEISGDPPYLVRMTRRWFPSDDELLAELDKCITEKPINRSWGFSHWWDQSLERSDPDDRASRLIFEWLDRDCSQSRFLAAAEVIGDRGKRRDLDALLERRLPGNSPEILRALADTEFAVKRRSLE